MSKSIKREGADRGVHMLVDNKKTTVVGTLHNGDGDPAFFIWTFKQ